MIKDEVTINHVNTLSDHAENIPSEQADWAGMTSSTKLKIQNESIFEDCGIAIIGNKYDHNYQVITSTRIHNLKRMQEKTELFNDNEKNKEGIVTTTDDRRETYTLEGCIRSLLHTLITDGRHHGNPTKENITVEYTKHKSLNEYIVLIKWS